MKVLILVVVDNGLVQVEYSKNAITAVVLILVVVDNGLVPSSAIASTHRQRCLNPCCSGQWSSTRHYKTLLIINKLKNFTKEIFTFLN